MVQSGLDFTIPDFTIKCDFTIFLLLTDFSFILYIVLNFTILPVFTIYLLLTKDIIKSSLDCTNKLYLLYNLTCTYNSIHLIAPSMVNNQLYELF